MPKHTSQALLIAFTALAICLVSPVTRAQNTSTPPAAETDAARNKPCRDPWINIIYQRQWRRAPVGSDVSLECDPANYNGGQWNGFLQLYDAAINFQVELERQRIGLAYLKLNETTLMPVLLDLTKGANDPARIVANGGNNIVGSNAGAIIAAGGGNLISDKGLGFRTQSGSAPSFEIINSASASGGRRIIKIGNRAIVVR